MVKIDLSNASSSLIVYKDVDIGGAAGKALVKSNMLTALEKMEFRMNCIAFLTSIASKIIERSPMKFKMVRMVSCLLPTSIVRS